jgi:hypothetical protein
MANHQRKTKRSQERRTKRKKLWLAKVQNNQCLATMPEFEVLAHPRQYNSEGHMGTNKILQLQNNKDFDFEIIREIEDQERESLNHIMHDVEEGKTKKLTINQTTKIWENQLKQEMNMAENDKSKTGNQQANYADTNANIDSNENTDDDEDEDEDVDHEKPTSGGNIDSNENANKDVDEEEDKDEDVDDTKTKTKLQSETKNGEAAIMREEVIIKQGEDKEIQMIIEFASNDPKEKPEYYKTRYLSPFTQALISQRDNLKVKNGLLFFSRLNQNGGSTDTLVVPSGMINNLL